MGIFDPVWKTKNFRKEEKAAAAVRKISDPAKLMEIALTAPLDTVRCEAVGRISDPALLSVIAVSASDGTVQREAVRRIRDPRLLCGIVMADSRQVESETRQTAFQQINDQDTLFRIAQTSIPFGRNAAERITDQASLREIAMGMTRSPEAPTAAISRISDPKALEDIALHAEMGDARTSAIIRLKDFDSLLRIAAGAEDWAARGTAYDAIDSNFREGRNELSEEQTKRLAGTICTEADKNVKISLLIFRDKDELARIYQNAKREDIRAEAYFGIHRCGNFPVERLRDAYKFARRKETGASESHWREITDRFERFITVLHAEDTAFMLECVKDAECGPHLCGMCLHNLFSEKLNDREDIEELRDEGVRAFIENIPFDGKTAPGWSEARGVACLADAIPKERHERYDLLAEDFYYEDEDRYGRNKTKYTELTFRGKKYS